MTSRIMRSCGRDVLSIDRPADSSARTAVLAEPNADLLDRALAGWERFLRTFEAAPDE
ncbi:hypothetical protein [Streptomyces sp. NBC_00158]|uniref:hypothetical protein n=1 Tax=Streptomyces sp. NBC_00158 TaxID=2903627 RepID=UPI003245C707